MSALTPPPTTRADTPIRPYLVSSAPTSGPRYRLRPFLWTGLEPIVLAGLLLVALLLRARFLSDIPRYTDEVNEVQAAIDIARGRGLPLTAGSKHLGAFFDYVLAFAMLGLGRYPDLPRQVVLIAGLATVLLTYGYARSLSGRVASLLAAGLLTVSAPHVLLSSRVAWSASLTPLLLVGAAWALDLAVSRRRPWGVMVAGLLAGLALQAHPSVAALLPGLGAFALVRGRHLLRRPELYLGGLLFILACSNVLVYNWQSGSGGVRSVNRQYQGEAVGPAAYLDNLAGPTRGLVLTLASAVDPTREPVPFEPFVLLVAGVSLVALVYLARRAHRASPLPLLVVVSALALLPLLHDEFDPLLKSRYIMPLVPLAFAAVGVLGADLLAKPVPAAGGMARRLAVGGVWLLMAGGMLAALLHFESVALVYDCTNAPQRALVAELERHREPREWVLLDEGAVRRAERLGYLGLLEWSGARVGEASLGRGGARKALEERSSFLTFVDDGKAATIFERQGLPLLPRSLTPSHPGQRDPGSEGKRGDGGIGLYRITPEGATLLAHDPEPGCGSLRLN